MKKIFTVITALICAVGCMAGCFTPKDSGQDALKDVTVYMPDGAPALALAGMMHLDGTDDGVEYYVTKADAIASKVSFEDGTKNADFCVMPLNLAAKNAKVQANYVMLGSVTNGNLYMISKTEAQYNADNLDSLVGKTVGVLQINNVPGLTFKTVLNRRNGGGDYASGLFRDCRTCRNGASGEKRFSYRRQFTDFIRQRKRISAGGVGGE